MSLLETPTCDFGSKAPQFSLPDVYGQLVSLDSVVGKGGLVCSVHLQPPALMWSPKYRILYLTPKSSKQWVSTQLQ